MGNDDGLIHAGIGGRRMVGHIDDAGLAELIAMGTDEIDRAARCADGSGAGTDGCLDEHPSAAAATAGEDAAAIGAQAARNRHRGGMQEDTPPAPAAAL